MLKSRKKHALQIKLFFSLLIISFIVLFSVYVQIDSVGEFRLTNTIQKETPQENIQKSVQQEKLNIPLTTSEKKISSRIYYYGADLVATKQNSVVTYYHQDYLSSVRTQSNVNKNKFSSTRSAPFGSEIYESSNALSSENNYKFTGQESDETLYYYGARYYDSATGRFTQLDPVMSSETPYAYVSNNPLKFVDPTGADLNTVMPRFSIISDTLQVSDESVLIATETDQIPDKWFQKDGKWFFTSGRIVTDDESYITNIKHYLATGISIPYLKDSGMRPGTLDVMDRISKNLEKLDIDVTRLFYASELEVKIDRMYQADGYAEYGTNKFAVDHYFSGWLDERAEEVFAHELAHLIMISNKKANPGYGYNDYFGLNYRVNDFAMSLYYSYTSDERISEYANTNHHENWAELVGTLMLNPGYASSSKFTQAQKEQLHACEQFLCDFQDSK